MDCIDKFMRDESGQVMAEYAALTAIASVLSEIWNDVFNEIWDSLIDNPLAFILVVFTLVFGWWIIFKA